MATLYPRHTTAQNFSDATWSIADDDAKDHVAPTLGDAIQLTVNSGKVTCDVPWSADSLDADVGSAAEWAFSDQSFSVTNNITLDDITATIDDCVFSCTSLDIGTDGSLSNNAGGTVSITGDLLLDGGTVTGNSYEMVVTGNAYFSSGTVETITLSVSGDYEAVHGVVGADLVINLTGTGTFKQRSYAYALKGHPKLICAAAGKTTTFLSTSYLDRITLGPGIATGGASSSLYMRWISGDDCIDQDTVNSLTVESIYIVNYLTSVNQKAFTVTGCSLLAIHNYNNKPVTFTGSVDVGNAGFDIEAIANSHVGRAVFSTGSLTCGDITLGKAASTDRSGNLTLATGSENTIRSIAGVDATSIDNGITFAGTTTITVAFDTSNIKTVNLNDIITVPTITAESTATNNTTLTLTDDTTLIGNLVVNESAGVTTLNTNSKEFTIKGNVTGADTPVITALTLRSIGITNVIEWPATVSPITELLIGRGTEITSTGGINATKITTHTATKAASKGGWIAR